MVSLCIAIYFAARRFGARALLAILAIPSASTTASTSLWTLFIALEIVAVPGQFLVPQFVFIQFHFGFKRKIVVMPVVGIYQILIDAERKPRGLARSIGCSRAVRGSPLGISGARSIAVVSFAALALSMRTTASFLFALLRPLFVS
jgi:hypothetical protein